MVVLMGDKIVVANGVLGMVKYAATRFRSKYVVGREGWKSMVWSMNGMVWESARMEWVDGLGMWEVN